MAGGSRGFTSTATPCLFAVEFVWSQDDLKAEAQAAGQAYLSDPSYQEATQMSFADLFKKVIGGSGGIW